MIYAINYANDKYRNAQKLNTQTALLHGAEKVIEYSSEDIDTVFYNANEEILSCKRGNGYWLWKPYIIEKTLEKINKNDYLIYSDAGSYYINDIDLLIECMEKENIDIMPFSLGETSLERVWSKRDAFILMGCDSAEYIDTPQRLASFILLKKTEPACVFIHEWLAFAQDARIITDQPNCMGKENYPGFKENRHDQTILSLLSKKYNMKSFRNPSCVAVDDWKEMIESNYPQIFQLHRMGDVGTVEELERRYHKYLEKLLQLWQDGKKIILYGAGKKAGRVISYAKRKSIKIDACVVSDSQTIDETKKEGIPVYYISEMPYMTDESIIIVTINSADVFEWLKKNNFSCFSIDANGWTALKYFENID